MNNTEKIAELSERIAGFRREIEQVPIAGAMRIDFLKREIAIAEMTIKRLREEGEP
jgi:hypothetical protein